MSNFNLNDFNLWTALVTPFNKDLSVDWDSLKSLVKEQEEAGNGLLILGSTGEALNLGLETRKEIIEYVTKLSPSVPVMAGVGGHNLEDQKSWVSWLETQNIDAYLMVVPIYAKPGAQGQYHWFKSLMDKVSRPVMLYNVPGRTGKELEVSALERLKDHKNFWALKEASGDVNKFKAYLKASGNAQVYCGDDGLFPEFADAGSCGLVSVASNTWPKQTALYVQKALDKSLEENKMWEAAANSLFIASNPIPAKRLLKLEHRIGSDALMPPLTSLDLDRNDDILAANNNVNEWFKKYNN
ncbi:MAG: 4-hydroxy-tetrahydrodipicolinate synthase [Halobacteriovoraceae bacterium]|nr:4-hydroxy-tetrahydrodipicolinate synthase [Halobacteriovoraceae bacterium]|tara:strand:- start:109801 stop:110694 length:894 start_codon:yes stop_codon:yes gene_type:complete